MACIPDTVTPKGVLINLNSGSDYTNCTVYTGLTDSVITGATNCVNVTGTTCSLTGISATLLEIYVRIDCEGCCSNTFRVNLDECCGYEEVLTPTPTAEPTPTPTAEPTPTPTAEPTPTPSVCQCNTYRITFNNNCGEAINWTDCDTEVSMSEQGNYFGLSDLTFIPGTVLDLCSCTLPTTTCGATISLISSGCTLEGGFTITTPTPTPTPTPTVTVDVTCTCYELYTTPNLNPTSAFLGNSTFTYRSCGTNEIEMIQISDEGFGNPSGTRICARTGSVEQTSGDSGYSIESEINCCESVEPTPTPTTPIIVLNVGGSMEPCGGGTIDDHMGAFVNLNLPVVNNTSFDVTVYYEDPPTTCSGPFTGATLTQSFTIEISAGQTLSDSTACSNGVFLVNGANICGACITFCSDPSINLSTFSC